jgi:hypothetical protein
MKQGRNPAAGEDVTLPLKILQGRFEGCGHHHPSII